MIILSKLADYGVIIATRLAAAPTAGPVTAPQLAAETRLPPATVAKLLKLLARGGVVVAARGASGGYRLARPAAEIALSQVVAAIDGAFAMTQCTGAVAPCDRLRWCPTRPHWQRINEAVAHALDSITLDEMIVPVRAAPLPMVEALRAGTASLEAAS